MTIKAQTGPGAELPIEGAGVGWEIREGDALERLREMPDASVQCCVTSPPYFGLRDYGTGEWDGGEDGCEHYQGRPGAGRADGIVDDRKQRNRDGIAALTSGVCSGCGARRTDRQLGLEATPDEYVAKLVEVFREVRRVLRADGTLWLNIGDSYAGTWGNQGRKAERGTQRPINGEMLTPVLDGRYPSQASGTGTIPKGADYKAKDLLGIPWLLAFALRADGWYLRSDIIWAKPNPMPESVTDRPTSAHEHVFLLSKSARYMYDADAIRENYAPGSVERIEAGFKDRYSEVASGGFRGSYGGPNGEQVNTAGRNKRNVWEIATQPYREAHFATFPCKLVEPCILAGSSPKACGECGAPWVRVVETSGGTIGAGRGQRGGDNGNVAAKGWESYRRETTGWQPSCAHQDATGHSVILDPFAGSGITGLVALRHDRSFIGIELSPAYAEMARNRIRDDAPLLNSHAEAAR